MPEERLGDFSAEIPLQDGGEIKKEETLSAEELPENAVPSTNMAKNVVKETSDEVAKANEVAHLYALDRIGDYLTTGKFSQEEQKKFFEEHPEYAQIANKSKKYKDSYRELMAEKKTETDDIEYLDKESLVKEITDKVQETNLQNERKKLAFDEAVKEGLNTEKAEELYRIAEAVYKATEVSYSTAINSAKSALGIKSNSAKSLPTSDTIVDKTKGKDKDSEIKRIMSDHLVQRKLAEKIYNHGVVLEKNNVSVDLGKGFMTVPLD